MAAGSCRWARSGFLVLGVPSESWRPEDRSRLALAHAVVIAPAAARSRADSFDHHSFKAVVSVALSITRPDTEEVPSML